MSFRFVLLGSIVDPEKYFLGSILRLFPSAEKAIGEAHYRFLIFFDKLFESGRIAVGSELH